MTNIDYINKYKQDNVIIATKFSDNGKIIDDIVVPFDIDNRSICSPTDDQGETPHCTGYAASQLIEAIHWKKSGIPIQIDAHQVYAKAKELDGQLNVDGSYLEYALSAGAELCSFKNVEIKTFRGGAKIDTVKYIKHLIHKYDLLLGGFSITQGWYYCTATEYKIKHYGANLGGHAVVIAGYSDSEGGFIIENQWGKRWGAKGFAIMPYDVFKKEFIYCAYMTNMLDNMD